MKKVIRICFPKILMWFKIQSQGPKIILFFSYIFLGLGRGRRCRRRGTLSSSSSALCSPSSSVMCSVLWWTSSSWCTSIRQGGQAGRTDSIPSIVLHWDASPNLSPLCLQYTTLPVRLYNCRQSRRGDVGWVVSRRRESAVRSQSDIQYMYSLGQTEPQNKKRVPTTLLISEKKPNPKKLHLGVLILASCWKEEIFKFVHPVQCPPFGLE